MSEQEPLKRMLTTTPANTPEVCTPEPQLDADGALQRQRTTIGRDVHLTAAERMPAFPGLVDVGEHVVGSCHERELVEPVAIEHATVAVAPCPATGIDSEAAKHDFFSSQLRHRAEERAAAFSAIAPVQRTDSPIAIRFHPTSAGVHEADVKLILRWTDGLTDIRNVRAVGRAFRIDDAPASGSSDPTGASSQQFENSELKGVNAKDHQDFEDAFQIAANKASDIATQQGNGALTAQQNAAKYHKRPDPEAWWAELARIAITMAVGGIAGLVARAVSTSLAPSVVKHAFPNSSNPAIRYSEVAIGDSIKDGMKAVARRRVAELQFGPHARGGTVDGERISNDPMLEWFAIQQRKLAVLAGDNKDIMMNEKKRLTHLLEVNPQAAIGAMTNLSMSLGKVATEEAANVQQRECEHGWISVVARSANGHRQVAGVNGIEQTTKFDDLDLTDGVLNLFVSNGKTVHNAITSVDRVSVYGVSNLIAERLRFADLRNAHLPIRLYASDISLYASRDEAGRVRVLRGTNEARLQRHDLARELIDDVLAKSLAQWGISAIETNDDGKGV